MSGSLARIKQLPDVVIHETALVETAEIGAGTRI
jgi:hypothetical protein